MFHQVVVVLELVAPMVVLLIAGAVQFGVVAMLVLTSLLVRYICLCVTPIVVMAMGWSLVLAALSTLLAVGLIQTLMVLAVTMVRNFLRQRSMVPLEGHTLCQQLINPLAPLLKV